jgi:tetratricopeptide (TPR) repeat protein
VHSITHNRVGTTILALAFTWALAGCGPDSKPPQNASAATFQFPDVDLSNLPDEMKAGALAAEQSARTNPGSADAVGGLGMHYMAYSFPLAAARCFAHAATLSPRSLRWHYLQGLAEERAGRMRKAISALEKAVAADSGFAPALVKLGDALVESDPSRSSELYRDAIKLNHTNARAHFGLARSWRKEGNSDAALASLTEAIRIYPEYADAHYAMAMIFSAKGDKKTARIHLAKHGRGSSPPIYGDPYQEELSRIGAGSSFDLVEDANRLAESGRLVEAESLLRRALRTDFSGTSARKQLGVVLGRQKKFSEAVTEFRIVVEQDPTDEEARTNLGRALEGLGRTSEAEQEYRVVINSDPRHADAHLYLGQLLARTNRVEEGLNHLRKSSELQPSNGEAQYFLGVTLAQAGKPVDAAEILHRAIQLMPEHVGALFTLGQVQVMMDQIPEAKASWEKAVRLSPKFANGHANLARLSISTGDHSSAVASAELACQATGFRIKEHLLVLAVAYEKAGRPDEASDMKRRAAALR